MINQLYLPDYNRKHPPGCLQFPPPGDEIMIEINLEDDEVRTPILAYVEFDEVWEARGGLSVHATITGAKLGAVWINRALLEALDDKNLAAAEERAAEERYQELREAGPYGA